MIGQRVRRTEDERLVRGRGRYTADEQVAGLRHIAVLRSSLAHAIIRNVDTTAATALPGVVAVFDGEAVRDLCHEPMRIGLPIPGVEPMEWYPLAVDRVRYVGEPVAAVVAISRAVAEDAVELIDLELEPLPVVMNVEAALEPDAPRLFDTWASNEMLRMRYENGDPSGVSQVAPHVLRERFINQRVTGVPIEGHAVTARFDRVARSLAVTASNQWPHQLQSVIADVCGLPHTSVHVTVPDMGGGFGNKQAVLRDEMLVPVLATAVECPVRWVQDRSENLIASVHSHDAVHEVEVSYDDQGRVLALQATLLCDLGSPNIDVHTVGPHLVSTAFLTGSYDIQDYSYDFRAVVTNKCTSGGYRGYGQPEAHFTIERIMDIIAAERKLDPADVRRRNLIPDGPRPYISAVGSKYDIGSVRSQFDALLDAFDYEGWRERQVALRAEGRLIGIGLSSLIEGSAADPFGLSGRFGAYEVASVSVHPDGSVRVAVGTKSQGQGHETIYAQCAASALGTDLTRVTVRDGDTSLLPHGTGTSGSRSATMGGGAVLKAANQLRRKCSLIASILLKSDPGDVEVGPDGYTADGKTVTLRDVARVAWWQTFLLPPDLEPGLTAIAVYDTKRTSPIPNAHGHMNLCATYGSGATAAVVEVDANSGRTQVIDAVMVHDCGVVINPTLLEGQLQGGFIQGIGMALHEEVKYDEAGQPLTGTLLDYHIPTIGDAPVLRIIHTETPSGIEGGFRGAGEATIICGGAVVANAVADAIGYLGPRVTTAGVTPQRVRKLLRDAGVAVDLRGLRRRTRPTGPLPTTNEG